MEIHVFCALPDPAKAEGTKANEGLNFCNQLFAIERDIKDLTYEERYQIRLEQSKPVLDAFSAWLREQTPKTLPKSALGKAIKYCRNQWDKLVVFLEDGRLEIDNNRSERSIKPFVIGRKAWIFANTPRGAKASAVTYSIVETAKENGLNSFAYLTYLDSPYSELLKYGMYEELFIDHLDVYVYSRSFKGQRLLVITNFSNKEVQLNIGERLKEIVLGNYEDTLLLNGNVTVRPYECMVYELD